MFQEHAKRGGHCGSSTSLQLRGRHGSGPKGRSRHVSEESCSSSSSSSSSFSSSSSVSLPEPPDGGWGWVVVCASFMVHMIADGCAFSFGVLYVELLETFDASRSNTAWVGSLFVAMPLITGPFAGAITNRYGCRTATIVGGFIAGCAFVLSSYANSIMMLCFTFGVLAGIGLSMCYVSAIVVVAFYFESKRAFATGLAVAGSGIGTFIFAPLTEFLIDEYNWRGALLILGGLMFNIMVAGTIFRPLTSEKLERKKRKYLENLQKFAQYKSHLSVQENHALMSNGGVRGSPLRPNQGGMLPNGRCDPCGLLDEPVTHSLMQFPTFLKKELSPLYPEALREMGNEGKTLQEVLLQHGLMDKFVLYHSVSEVDISHTCNRSTDNVRVACMPQDLDSKGVPDEGNHQELLHCDDEKAVKTDKKRGRKEDLVWKRQPKQKASKKLQQNIDQLLPLHRKDIFYRGNLIRTGLVMKRTSASCPNIPIHYEGAEPLVSDSEDDDQEHHFMYKFLNFSKAVKNIIRKMLDVSILRSVLFLYFCLSSFLLYFAYDVPYVFTPDKANRMGISDARSSFLVSIIGISSTVGQVVIGWLGDLPQVNSVHLYNILTSIAGVVTILVPWLTTYSQLCVYAASYGFFISGNYALTTIILVQLLGMDKLTNAYGIVMLAEGVANVLGPPGAGWLCDYTGGYKLTFVIYGAIILLSGIMLSAMPCLLRCDHHHIPGSDTTTFSSEATSMEYEKTQCNHSNGTSSISTAIKERCIPRESVV